jgi:hypothetical protein
MRWRGPIRQPVPAAGTNKASPAPGLTRTAKNRPTGIRESPAPGQRDETGADRKASGYTHRSFRPDAVRYMSVTTATHRPTVTRADTWRDKTKTAELRDLQERVTAHLAAIPASWGVDSDGVTGPEAGRAGDAAVLPAAERLDEIPGLGREAAAALIAEIGLDMSRFPSPQALVSWAGLTPTARQSGPRKGRGRRAAATPTPSRSPSWPPTPPRTPIPSWASASAAWPPAPAAAGGRRPAAPWAGPSSSSCGTC